MAKLIAKQSDRPAQLRLATIDARLNEIPPPHGSWLEMLTALRGPAALHPRPQFL